jgi:hypothetical protein
MSRRPLDLDPAVAAAERGEFIGSGRHSSKRRFDPAMPPPARGPPEGLELERVLPLIEVAALTGLSQDTLKRHYAHLIRHLSPRRIGMKVRDAISIGA